MRGSDCGNSTTGTPSAANSRAAWPKRQGVEHDFGDRELTRQLPHVVDHVEDGGVTFLDRGADVQALAHAHDRGRLLGRVKQRNGMTLAAVAALAWRGSRWIRPAAGP
jgi:hypothetical protein